MILEQDIHVGVLGGGQLGGMLIRHAIDFGLYIHILDHNRDATCARYTNHFVLGDPLDYDTVVNFGKDMDIITIEKEAVNVDALEYLAENGVKVFPSPEVVRIVQDKYSQKEFLQKHGIPVADGLLIKNKEEIYGYKERLPACLKMCRDGYDGKGVMMLRKEEDIESAFDVPCVLEDLVDIDKELAVIVSRNEEGSTSTYEPVEMIFDPEKNLLDYQLAPADITEQQVEDAMELAVKTAQALDLVGILAVEMFLTKEGKIIVNELAPRPHNSGHHTIEACVTSQYEQLIRAILGLQPGYTRAHKKSVMINILEPPADRKAEMDGLMERVMSTTDAHLHWYGKKNNKEGRKIGHITICGDTMQDVILKAKIVRNTIKEEQ